MKTRLLAVAAVGLCMGAVALRADDQPDVKPVLEKAMKAMNGEAKLAKLTTVAAKCKLTHNDGNMEITVDLDGTFQGMSQYKADVEVQVGGNSFKGVMVFNGDKGWFKKDDKTDEAPEGVGPFVQNFFYAGRLPLLLPAFKDKDFKLTPLGEVMVGTQPAIGVSISHKDRKDVSLFFDKDKGLPIKSEIRLSEPRTDKEIMVEYHYSDYKDFNGVKVCSKIAIKFDNKEFALELSELKGVNKLDDSHFDRP
jgi:hypothetical protein